MLEDMEKQNELYKPTTFWRTGSKYLIKELDENNIEDFRKLNVTRGYFVPGYTAPEYYIDQAKYDYLIDEFDSLVTDKRFITRIKRTFTGYTTAYNDYKILQASNIDKKPYTNLSSESQIGNPIEQHEFNNRKFSRSFLNYSLGLNFLKKNVDTTNISTVMEIGGGFGTLGEILLKDKRNDTFYINADIPPVGFVSSYYLQEVFGKDNIATYEDTKDLKTLDINDLKEKYKALNICSWEIPKLQGKIDLFVNFISFQEMEPDVVKNYCSYINKLEPQYILLRNMLEGKKKRDSVHTSGVDEPILGKDYDSFFPKYELVTSDSDTFGFVTEDGFHSQLRIYKKINENK